MSIEFYTPSNLNYESDGNVSLQPKKAIFKLSLNGVSEIEVEQPYDKEGRWKLICNEGVIKSPTPYSNGQLFSIYSIKKNMLKTGLIIKARHIFFDLYYSTTEDIRAVNCNCQKALDILLEGTKYKGYSNISAINTCYFVKQNRIASINGDTDNTIIKRWGGEIFLDNYKVYINNKIGDDYGVSISYGINMLDLGITEDMQNVVTRIKPVAFNGRRLPELYIDSPLINKYRITYEKYVEFGNLKLKDDLQNEADTEDGSIVFKTEEELYNAMREECKKLFEGGIDKPNLKGSVKMAALENTEAYKDVKGLVNVSLGDTITVYNKMLNIDFKTRCIGYEWDILSQKYLNIQIGDYVKNYFENQTDIRNKIDSILNKNGNVKSESLEGVIDAVKTQFRAMRDIAQPQEVRAMIFEDKIKGSDSYGAMCLGSMGFMIASERTPDDKDWNWRTFGSGQGFFADWLVGKLKTVLIESMDGKSFWNLETGDFCLNGGRIIGKNGNFEMNLQKEGELSFKNNGKEAIKIHNNAIDLFNWSNDSDYIGSLMSLCKIINGKPDPEKPLIGLTHDNNSSISLGYQKEDGNFSSYMELDKYNILGHAAKAPIKVFEHIEMNDNIIYNPKLKADNALQIYINGSLIATFGEKGLWLNVPIFNKDGHLAFDPMAPQGETVDGSDELRNKIVNSARKLIGKWYVYGGNFSPLGNDSGTDCSGLMQWAYNDNSIKISRTTYTQIKEGTEVSEGDLKPGDLVFPSTEHVFMYSGESNGRHMCVEAAHTGTQIRERAFSWGSGYRARRIIKESSSGGGGSVGGSAGSKASANILYYVKGIEGFGPNYYYDTVGVRTLGYGMTGGELNGISVPISEASATHYLTKFFNRDYYEQVLRIVKSKGVKNPKQREIDAFASFAYNLGVPAFSDSTLLKKYVAGERGEAIHEQFKRWVHAGGSVHAGLVRRREEEWKIFSNSGHVAGYNGRPYIEIINGGGSVTSNGGYGASPY